MGKKKDIDDNKRAQIMQFLLDCSKGGKVQHGMMNTATLKFQVCGRTVRSIWNTAKTQFKGGRVIDVASKRCKVIRPKKHVIDYAAIEQIEVQKRGTIQGLSDALHISKSTVGRWNTAHLLRPHTSSIRSLLTAHNMLVRLSFSLQAIHQSPQLNCIQFKAMENTIHIDEKWFYLTRNTCRYYLTPMEENPHRVCKSKNFIPKVMFMCAVSRPVFDSEGRVLFDGKIGIWPFIEEVAARRSSINRKKGLRS